MPEDPPPQKIPLIFFRTAAGSEPVREWLKGLPEVERRSIGKRPLAGTMALANWYAAMPGDGRRPLGNPHRSADEADGPGAAVRLPRTSRGAPRLHQKIAGNAG